MQRKIKRIFILFASVIFVILLLLLFVFFYKRTGIAPFCIFKKITTLNCPGCGNSRAVLSILKLDFYTAYKMNRIIFLEILYGIYLFVFGSKKYICTGKFTFVGTSKIINYSFLAILIIWFIIRNIYKM